MNLKRYLFEKTVPIKEFAEQLGVSASLIYLILKRKRFPSPKLATKIENLTDGMVTKEELLFPDETSPQKWVLNEGDIQERLEAFEPCEQVATRPPQVEGWAIYLALLFGAQVKRKMLLEAPFSEVRLSQLLLAYHPARLFVF